MPTRKQVGDGYNSYLTTAHGCKILRLPRNQEGRDTKTVI